MTKRESGDHEERVELIPDPRPEDEIPDGEGTSWFRIHLSKPRPTIHGSGDKTGGPDVAG